MGEILTFTILAGFGICTIWTVAAMILSGRKARPEQEAEQWPPTWEWPARLDD